MSDGPDYIADAITSAFGERCPDYGEHCPVCNAWKQYDEWKSAVSHLSFLMAPPPPFTVIEHEA